MASKLSWKLKLKGESLPRQPITVHIRQGDGTEPDADDRTHFPRPRTSPASFTAGNSGRGKKVRAVVR